ncbi:hypothetical protein LSUB1_G004799 [Lachnellula subtilissima]|uniref:Gfd2/YDR514C-like C-terminal domain-containing protein n=1 Tax=Lachnellula subtilissima TaxID=602034 RepID=A0A8H8RNE9_9HELO|nr:hypothetical protein LSUB1_G004799 [Lachnellula subtilissima]
MEISSDKPQLPIANENLPSGKLQVLREETLALRDLLGLNLKRSDFIVDPSLRTLAQSAGIKDVLFLAIDIEGTTCQPALPSAFQLGISILDTRHLQTLISRHLHDARNDDDDGETELQSILQTYNFCDGTPTYCLRAQRRLLFGDTEELVAEEMNARIQALIAGRDVILVVHGGKNDLRFLDRIKISIQPLFTLDTQKAAQNPLQLLKRPSLESFLTTFEIPFISHSFHTGGNDANYTLRSLLMIAVIDSEGEEGLSDEQLALLGVIRGIARSAIPEDRVKKSQVIEGKGRRLTRLEAKRRKKERKAMRKLARKNEMEEGPVNGCSD